MMHILRRISEPNSESAFLLINEIIENTNFIRTVVDYYIKKEPSDTDNYLDFFYDTIKFLHKYILIFSKTNNININSNSCKNILENIINRSKNKKKNEKILLIINEIKYYQKQVNIKKERKEKKGQNDRNYKDMNAIIDTKDFKEEIKNKKIDKNIIKGEYESNEKYINTLFFLEYEDCYRNLRRAIFNLFKEGKSLNILNKEEKLVYERRNHDVYCYLEGEIVNAEMNYDGIFITIEFTPLVGTKIKFTKRMINGSLVIITDNDFKDFLLTTVSYNPYIESKLLENSNDKRRKEKLDLFGIPKEPRYKIKFELININSDSFIFLFKNRTNLQLFESKAYFQSYIHVLNRLKQIIIKDIPFQEEIIKVNFQNLLIDNREDYKYKAEIINPNNNKFPEYLQIILDESQKQALRHCLLNKIALIQGPPGTGKTHVGSILINIFRENLKNDSKILIVCFTNHALDQFLENILKDNNNVNDIVRIGGRCKNEKIKQLVINNNEKWKDKDYLNYIKNLNLLRMDMKETIKLIYNNNQIDANRLIKEFPDIYKKVISDFFKLLDIKKEDYINKLPLDIKTINKYTDKDDNLDKKKEKIIGLKIFHFWLFTGQKNNNISDLISNIFEDMDIDNYNEIIEASSNFKDFSNDNNKLLNELKIFKKEKKKKY